MALRNLELRARNDDDDDTRLNSLDLTSRTGPDSYQGWYTDQASEHVFSLTVAHATAMLSRQPKVN